MKRILTLSLATAAVALAASSAGAATVAHWRFEGSLEDASGKGNTATVSTLGGPASFHGDVANLAPGSQSLELGLGAWVDTGVSLPQDTFTVELFLRREVASPVKGAILSTFDHLSLDGDPDNAGFALMMRTGGTLQVLSNGNVIDGVQQASDGGWHHVALTYDATQSLSLYVDGVLEGSMAADPQLTSAAANALRLGAGHEGTVGGNPFNFWDGKIDEVRISTHALAPSQFLNNPQMGGGAGHSHGPSVPEPSSFLMMSMALGAGTLTRRSRKS